MSQKPSLVPTRSPRLARYAKGPARSVDFSRSTLRDRNDPFALSLEISWPTGNDRLFTPSGILDAPLSAPIGFERKCGTAPHLRGGRACMGTRCTTPSVLTVRSRIGVGIGS